MFIMINNVTYNDIRRAEGNETLIFTGDSLINIEAVSGVISVYANDGFLLREDNTEDWQRQIIRDGAITLTNLPEDYKPPKTIGERVNELEQTGGISFRIMAESGEIDEETAAAYPDMFLPWDTDTEYKAGNLRAYEDILYKCILDHTSQEAWTPDVAVSLWVKAGNPTEEWPEWVQPTGAHDAYNTGDKVSHNEAHWISTMDANIYEPGVYGWTEVTE